MRGAAAGAVLLGAFLQGCNHIWVVGQTQVIITAKRQVGFIANSNARTLWTGDNTPGTIQVLFPAQI